MHSLNGDLDDRIGTGNSATRESLLGDEGEWINGVAAEAGYMRVEGGEGAAEAPLSEDDAVKRESNTAVGRDNGDNGGGVWANEILADEDKEEEGGMTEEARRLRNNLFCVWSVSFLTAIDGTVHTRRRQSPASQRELPHLTEHFTLHTSHVAPVCTTRTSCDRWPSHRSGGISSRWAVPRCFTAYASPHLQSLGLRSWDLMAFGWTVVRISRCSRSLVCITPI